LQVPLRGTCEGARGEVHDHADRLGGRPNQVVDDVVRYLDAPPPSPTVAQPDEPRPSGYYTDGSNEPGRWLGTGAARLGLAGRVDREDFARLLGGRDPRTGERLILATGSAGRRATIGIGAHTADGGDGERLYDARDAAAALGIEADQLDRLVRAGTAVAFASMLGGLTGRTPPHPVGPYLAARLQGGDVWITETELSRCEESRALGAAPEAVAAAGDAADHFSIAEAARVAGVTPRYLRRLAATYDRHRAEIDATRAAGRPSGRAYLIAARGTRGQWTVTRSDLVEFLQRRSAPAVRVGYDLTLTTEKSLGVLGLLGDHTTRVAVLDAIRAGNDAGMARLEARAAKARVGGKVVDAAGWSAASFAHNVSRALDPFPHHHNVVAAAVETTDGEQRVLDARHLYTEAPAASAIATLTMRHHLTTTLGVRWRQVPRGGWEVAGIPDEVLREFSKRRSEIDTALAHLETQIGRTASIDDLQRVVAATRPPKQQADANDLYGDWWRRARALGFTPESLAACRREPAPPPPLDREHLFGHLLGPHGVCASTSTFTHSDVIRALVDAPASPSPDAQPMLATPGEVEALADEFLASDHVIELGAADGRSTGESRYTTREVLGLQARIIDAYRSGLGAHQAVVDTDVVDDHLANSNLGADQAALVREFTTSGHRIQCAVGRAGSGKTTALAVAASAWQSAGYRVVGAAVKGEAARLLGHTADIPAETVAWYLVPRTGGMPPLDERTVLIVDEASTLSDTDLAGLISLTTATGATLRLIGDPAQHSAVTPGGMFRVLCEHHRALTPELAESRRLQHPADRAAAEHLRAGRVSEALATLHDAGHLSYAADDAALYAKLLDSWWRDHQAGRPHPLVERSNYRRRQLNRLARRLLQADGQLGPDLISASGGRAFAIGDRVTARRPARHLHPDQRPESYVRNGMAGTVVAATPGADRQDDQIHVDFEGIGVVVVPRSFFDDHRDRSGRLDAGVDHGYALTSYAVQGATFDASTSHIDENSSRAEVYVDATRGRRHNRLYATRREDPLDGEHLPKAPPVPLEATITAQLSKSGEVTAWELFADRHPDVASADRGVTRPATELS
jgi:conjugative relaxase-like TrwC/TraI family protein